MKKHSSKNSYIKHKPVLLRSWIGDFYGLGVFCAKANLVEYARKNMRSLRTAGEDKRLFDTGVSEADQCTLQDIAYEASHLRSLTGSAFDSYLYNSAGFKFVCELKEAMTDAHDWETQKQIEGGREIIDGMIDRRYETRQEILEALA